MNYFERRKYRKLVDGLLHEARHAINYREDIAPVADVQLVRKGAEALHAAWQAQNPEAMETAAEELSAAIQVLMPRRTHARLRENIEVLVVALSVAMAFRTYFIQPFKIPTGSMQPTLNGITAWPQTAPTWQDRFPINLVNLALFGERYVVVKAKQSGILEMAGEQDGEVFFYVGKKMHKVRWSRDPATGRYVHDKSMHMYVNPGDYVQKGQVIASGRVKIGDHIFVNKVKYNFVRPKRGDIIVFDTNAIQDPRIRRDSFYIKRLVGLPGERISLDDRHLVVNGQKITEPYPFERLLNNTNYDGYAYTPASQPSYLRRPGDEIQVGPNHFLPFGDNTHSSLDGRYFGPVVESSLVGPAFCVYWPLSSRWGRAR